MQRILIAVALVGLFALHVAPLQSAEGTVKQWQDGAMVEASTGTIHVAAWGIQDPPGLYSGTFRSTGVDSDDYGRLEALGPALLAPLLLAAGAVLGRGPRWLPGLLAGAALIALLAVTATISGAPNAFAFDWCDHQRNAVSLQAGGGCTSTGTGVTWFILSWVPLAGATVATWGVMRAYTRPGSGMMPSLPDQPNS